MKRSKSREPIGNKQITAWTIWRECEKRNVVVKVGISAANGEIRFSAEAKLAGDVVIYERNADLYALQREMIAKVADSVPFKWQPMLYVVAEHVEPHREQEDDDGAGVLVRFEPIEVAKAGSQRFHRKPGCTAIEKGWPRTGAFTREARNMGWGERPKSASLIPDTPENRSSVEQIVAGINAVSERVRQLMTPEQIVATLAAAAKGLLLTDQAKEKR